MRKTSLLKIAVLGLLALATSACVYNPPRVSMSYTVQGGGYYEPWDYYYYPDVQVYFHISNGYYFYRSGSRWVRTRVLPTFIHLDAHRVKLHIENNQPYRYHHQHVERYRPRPQYHWTPSGDRREREQNSRGYHDQQQYKTQRRVAPPMTTPRQQRELPRYYQPPRREVPSVYTRPTPLHEPHGKEKPSQQPSYHTYPVMPPASKGSPQREERKAHVKEHVKEKAKHRAKKKYQQYQQEESDEQQDQDNKKSRKQRRDEDPYKRFR